MFLAKVDEEFDAICDVQAGLLIDGCVDCSSESLRTDFAVPASWLNFTRSRLMVEVLPGGTHFSVSCIVANWTKASMVRLRTILLNGCMACVNSVFVISLGKFLPTELLMSLCCCTECGANCFYINSSDAIDMCSATWTVHSKGVALANLPRSLTLGH